MYLHSTDIGSLYEIYRDGYVRMGRPNENSSCPYPAAVFSFGDYTYGLFEVAIEIPGNYIHGAGIYRTFDDDTGTVVTRREYYSIKAVPLKDCRVYCVYPASFPEIISSGDNLRWELIHNGMPDDEAFGPADIDGFLQFLRSAVKPVPDEVI